MQSCVQLFIWVSVVDVGSQSQAAQSRVQIGDFDGFPELLLKD